MKRALAVVLLLLVTTAAAAATDPPHLVWLKAKCAVCHGEDGSGDTPQGRSRGVPDLRSEAVQKMTDDQLATVIRNGHGRMPSFKVQLSDQQVTLLVAYIRFIAKK